MKIKERVDKAHNITAELSMPWSKPVILIIKKDEIMCTNCKRVDKTTEYVLWIFAFITRNLLLHKINKPDEKNKLFQLENKIIRKSAIQVL